MRTDYMFDNRSRCESLREVGRLKNTEKSKNMPNPGVATNTFRKRHNSFSSRLRKFLCRLATNRKQRLKKKTQEPKTHRGALA